MTVGEEQCESPERRVPLGALRQTVRREAGRCIDAACPKHDLRTHNTNKPITNTATMPVVPATAEPPV